MDLRKRKRNFAKEKNPKTKKWQFAMQLNELGYKLYDLTEEKIAIIENSKQAIHKHKKI